MKLTLSQRMSFNSASITTIKHCPFLSHMTQSLFSIKIKKKIQRAFSYVHIIRRLEEEKAQKRFYASHSRKKSR